MFKKHLNKYQLMKHIARLRRKNSYWQLVPSQAMQDICDRIDKAYRLFFKFSGTFLFQPFCNNRKEETVFLVSK